MRDPLPRCLFSFLSAIVFGIFSLVLLKRYSRPENKAKPPATQYSSCLPLILLDSLRLSLSNLE